MRKLALFACCVVLSAGTGTAALAQKVTKVGPDSGTVTTTLKSGAVATTHVTRDGNTIKAVTTIETKPSYQPMGSGGGYKPMGR